MLALDLGQRVAQRIEEVVVGVEDLAVQRELDHRLGLVDGVDLAGEVGVADHLAGDVGRVFHHLEGLAGLIENRIVARLDPDLAPPLADALVLSGVIFATPELVPEQTIVGRLAIDGIDEHRMVLALDLVERVAQRSQKVLVGIFDLAVEREHDHRLRTIDGRELRRLAADLGDIRPFQHEALVDALRVPHRIDVERDLERSDGNVGAERQIGRIGEHRPLMRRIAVKDVDAGPDHGGGIEGRPDLAKLREVLAEQLLRGLIEVCDLEIVIDQHHGAGDLLDDGCHLIVTAHRAGRCRRSLRGGRPRTTAPRPCLRFGRAIARSAVRGEVLHDVLLESVAHDDLVNCRG